MLTEHACHMWCMRTWHGLRALFARRMQVSSQDDREQKVQGSASMLQVLLEDDGAGAQVGTWVRT
jgi:hypothetical protein